MHELETQHRCKCIFKVRVDSAILKRPIFSRLALRRRSPNERAKDMARPGTWHLATCKSHIQTPNRLKGGKDGKDGKDGSMLTIALTAGGNIQFLWKGVVQGDKVRGYSSRYTCTSYEVPI